MLPMDSESEATVDRNRNNTNRTDVKNVRGKAILCCGGLARSWPVEEENCEDEGVHARERCAM